MPWVSATVLLIAVLVGLYISYAIRPKTKRPPGRAGWIYFVSASIQSQTPIKIGRTARDPRKGERLTELRTMSPFPLKIIHTFYCNDAPAVERAIHEELKEYRLHGEWFDRDATLMFLDHIRGRN